MKQAGKLTSATTLGLKEKSKTNLYFKTQQKQQTQQKTSQATALALSSAQISKQKVSQKQKEAQKSASALALLSLTSQASSFKQTQTQRPRLSNSRPQPPKPKKIVIPKLDWENILQKTMKKVKKKEEEFEVFGKRFGKDISLGGFQTKLEAQKKLKSFLTGTLGRSGYVTLEGKKLPFGKLQLDARFRPSKKDPFRVVQKAKFSLGSFGERKEIQMFRKKKSKKKKKFKFF